MDVRTDKILPNETMELISKENKVSAKPMVLDPTEEQLKRGKIGRNDPCPCGSGLKFKRCCKTPEVRLRPKRVGK